MVNVGDLRRRIRRCGHVGKRGRIGRGDQDIESCVLGHGGKILVENPPLPAKVVDAKGMRVVGSGWAVRGSNSG